jgi:hypothetical protein
MKRATLPGLRRLAKRARVYLVRHRDFLRRRGKKYLKAEVHKIYVNSSCNIVLDGVVQSNVSLRRCEFVIRKFREDEIVFSSALKLSKPRAATVILNTVLRYTSGFRVKRFTCEIRGPWKALPSSLYNFTFVANGLSGSFIYSKNRKLIHTIPNTEKTVHIFFDEKSRGLRAEILNIGKSDIDALRERGRFSRPQRRLTECVIGEYPMSARDNGWALFESLRPGGIDYDPNIRVTYVIEGSNQDDISANGRDIVQWGSFSHLKRCIDAEVVAFSHDRINAYPAIIKRLAPDRNKTVKAFFLQHGVTALKKSVLPHYRRKRAKFNAVNVCSEWERNLFIDHFGYREDEVVVAGFPRHDRLFRMSKDRVSQKGRVLFVPTWRPGLARLDPPSAFASEYVQQWRSALTKVKELDGVTAALILHPIVSHFTEHFADCVDDIISMSSFQDALLSSDALVTDYSSVCFEALYVGKPVFFFMFDEIAYGIRDDAFLDVDRELFGPRSTDVDALLSDIKTFFITGTVTSGADAPMYFSQRDDKNCSRIASHISTLGERVRLHYLPEPAPRMQELQILHDGLG